MEKLGESLGKGVAAMFEMVTPQAVMLGRLMGEGFLAAIKGTSKGLGATKQGAILKGAAIGAAAGLPGGPAVSAALGIAGAACGGMSFEEKAYFAARAQTAATNAQTDLMLQSINNRRVIKSGDLP